jgi:hypothetical protein
MVHGGWKKVKRKERGTLRSMFDGVGKHQEQGSGDLAVSIWRGRETLAEQTCFAKTNAEQSVVIILF